MHAELSLTLTDTAAIAAAAHAYAECGQLRAAVAIVDESARLQYLLGMDGAPYTSSDGAAPKALTAAEGGHPTTFFEQPLNAGHYSMLTMPGIYPVEGAEPNKTAAKIAHHASDQPATGPHPAASADGLTSPWPPPRCLSCGTALDGGPVLFWCATCARAVHAADLDVEYRPAGPQTGTA